MASDETEGSNSHGGVAMPPSEDVPLLGKADDSLPPRNMLYTIVLYFMAIHFLVAFCEMILVAPLIKLFEQSLCLRHYNFPSGGVAESQCKILEIQHELATIRGWKSLFDTLPGAFNINYQTGHCSHISSASNGYSDGEDRRQVWPAQNYGFFADWGGSVAV